MTTNEADHFLIMHTHMLMLRVTNTLWHSRIPVIICSHTDIHAHMHEGTGNRNRIFVQDKHNVIYRTLANFTCGIEIVAWSGGLV